MEISFSANIHANAQLLHAEAKNLGSSAVVNLRCGEDDGYSCITLFLDDLVYATSLAEAINQTRLDYEQNRKEDAMEEIS